MIGWAASTNQVALLPFLMFMLVFLWTPPHFWALALFVKTDYANAGVPMLPVVAGERVTRTQIGLYTIPMAAVAVDVSGHGDSPMASAGCSTPAPM